MTRLIEVVGLLAAIIAVVTVMIIIWHIPDTPPMWAVRIFLSSAVVLVLLMVLD